MCEGVCNFGSVVKETRQSLPRFSTFKINHAKVTGQPTADFVILEADVFSSWDSLLMNWPVCGGGGTV